MTRAALEGIDLQAVNVIINFDFHKNAETHLHRSVRIWVDLISSIWPSDSSTGTTALTSVPAGIDKSLFVYESSVSPIPRPISHSSKAWCSATAADIGRLGPSSW
ncbi:hypothetical protein V8C44DRAFT_325714 [Trichoderma aethiopicum]